MDVIGSCAFGVEVDSLTNPEHPFVVNSAKMFNKGVSVLTLILFFLPILTKLLGSYIFKAVGFKYFTDVATNMLQLRKSDQNQKRVDFLQLMLDAQEGKLEKTEEENNPETDSHYTQAPVESKPWVSNKTISEDEILAQCVIFLLAGHETTATTINYIIYNLAMNPDVQEKLLQEVDEAWQKNGDIDYDAANKMTYLAAVVSETLRTHVIAPRVVREASEDYTIDLPNKTIVIPKGGQISIPVYAMHHDPAFFPDPEKFNPDRFLPENKDDIQPYTYLPFGDGPRNCVGLRFALMNIKLCMVHLLRQVKFVATQETKKPLEFIVGQGMLQAKSIVVKPEKRIKS